MKSKTPRTDNWRESDYGHSALAYDRCERIERELNQLLAVASKTIQDNLHLADGHVCTLKELRDAVNDLKGNVAAMPNGES